MESRNLTALAAIAGAALAATTAHASEADRAAITAAEYRMCAQTNMAVLKETIEFYGKDVIQFDVMPEPLVGQDAVRASLAKQFDRVHNMKCRIEGLRVGVNGDLGYAFSIQHFEADGSDGGPYQNARMFDESKPAEAATKVRMTWRQTDIWQKKDGKWTMLHQHSSFPIDLASAKPVMDMPDSYGK